MKKPIIAVDIDDVLSRTAQTVLDYGNDTWGHSHTLEDFNEHLSDMWQVEPDEANRRWLEYMESGYIERYDVIPAAREVLEQLSKSFTIIAVTSRRATLIDLTNQWLDSNYPGIITEVICAQIYGEGKVDAHKLTKSEVLQRISADYLIDDQPKHCIGAAGVGVQAILFGGYPWNSRVEIPDGVARCDTWHDIKAYFDGKA